jgi:hypothetical protein
LTIRLQLSFISEIIIIPKRLPVVLGIKCTQ